MTATEEETYFRRRAREYAARAELAEQVRREYDAGASLRELAARHNAAPSTVARLIRAAGGRVRPVGKPPKNPPTGLLHWLHS